MGTKDLPNHSDVSFKDRDDQIGVKADISDDFPDCFLKLIHHAQYRQRVQGVNEGEREAANWQQDWKQKVIFYGLV